jgi:hypothetical protein
MVIGLYIAAAIERLPCRARRAQATDAPTPASGIFSFVPDSGINAAAFNPS